jgi:hypothetical protein
MIGAEFHDHGGWGRWARWADRGAWLQGGGRGADTFGVRTATRWLTAAALLGLAGMIVLGWRIGPVVLVLTATHGVHLGDVLAGPPTLAALGLVGYRPRSRTTSTAQSTTPTIPSPRASQDRPTALRAAAASANSAI